MSNNICFKHEINPNIIINNTEGYYVIPFGQRCGSTLAIKFASLRKMSLPFDWTTLSFPKKIKNVLENNFKDFIPDVHNNIFRNKYDLNFPHFNNNIGEGIKQYERRIERFKKIIIEDKKMYFVYINEDYLYNERFRKKEFNDNIFSQMLELELYLKKKYPKINYSILYFNFIEHKIPKESNIINIVLNTNKLYNTAVGVSHTPVRVYCGKILSNLFKSKLILNVVSGKTFNEE